MSLSLTGTPHLYAFVDWDDTLKVTNALYGAVSEKNACLILEKLPTCSLTVAEIVTRVHAIDLAKTHTIGLHQRHYPDAWVEGYHELAYEYGTTPSEELTAYLYNEAAKVVHMPQKDYPGARDLLHYLRRMGCEITIWTAGDPQVQEAKVERSGYRSMVDRVCAVSDKNPDTLRRTLGNRNRERVFVIGNSPRSDVFPALRLGIWAIHILQDTWEYDSLSVDTHDPRYIAVHTLTEIPAVLTTIFGDPDS